MANIVQSSAKTAIFAADLGSTPVWDTPSRAKLADGIFVSGNAPFNFGSTQLRLGFNLVHEEPLSDGMYVIGANLQIAGKSDETLTLFLELGFSTSANVCAVGFSDYFWILEDLLEVTLTPVCAVQTVSVNFAIPGVVLTTYPYAVLDFLGVDRTGIVSGGTTHKVQIDFTKFQFSYYNDVVLTALTKSPQTGQSIGGATNAWVSPMNVTAQDFLYASQMVAVSADKNDYLQATNYGFNVPNTSTIVNVTPTMYVASFAGLPTPVSADRVEVGAGTETTQLVKAGIRTGNNVQRQSNKNNLNINTDFGFVWGVLAQETTATGSSYLLYTPDVYWGLSLSPADVNNSGFGLSLRYPFAGQISSSTTAAVNSLPITVWFTKPLPPSSNKYGYESFNVKTSPYTVRTVHAEFGYEITFDSTATSGGGTGGGGGQFSTNVGTISSEYGFEAQSFSFTQKDSFGMNTSNAQFGFEATSDSVRIVDFPTHSQYGFECSNVAFTKAAIFSPTGIAAEFGFEIFSVFATNFRIVDIFSAEFGYEDTPPTSVSQIDFFGMQDSSSEYGFEVTSPTAVTQKSIFGMQDSSSEYGFEIDTPRVGVLHSTDTFSAEFGYECSSLILRTFVNRPEQLNAYSNFPLERVIYVDSFPRTQVVKPGERIIEPEGAFRTRIVGQVADRRIIALPTG